MAGRGRGGAGFECPAPVPADPDLDHVIALRVEGLDDRARGGERDLVLARAPARQDRYAHTAAGQVHGGGGGPVVVPVVVPEYWPIVIVTVDP